MKSIKELQSLLEARTKALKEAQEKAEKLKGENDLILKEKRILKSIIREIKLVAESNTYSNDKVALRKIKELASTGIDN